MSDRESDDISISTEEFNRIQNLSNVERRQVLNTRGKRAAKLRKGKQIANRVDIQRLNREATARRAKKQSEDDSKAEQPIRSAQQLEIFNNLRNTGKIPTNMSFWSWRTTGMRTSDPLGDSGADAIVAENEQIIPRVNTIPITGIQDPRQITTQNIRKTAAQLAAEGDRLLNIGLADLTTTIDRNREGDRLLNIGAVNLTTNVDRQAQEANLRRMGRNIDDTSFVSRVDTPIRGNIGRPEIPRFFETGSPNETLLEMQARHKRIMEAFDSQIRTRQEEDIMARTLQRERTDFAAGTRETLDEVNFIRESDMTDDTIKNLTLALNGRLDVFDRSRVGQLQPNNLKYIKAREQILQDTNTIHWVFAWRLAKDFPIKNFIFNRIANERVIQAELEDLREAAQKAKAMGLSGRAIFGTMMVSRTGILSDFKAYETFLDNLSENSVLPGVNLKTITNEHKNHMKAWLRARNDFIKNKHLASTNNLTHLRNRFLKLFDVFDPIVSRNVDVLDVLDNFELNPTEVNTQFRTNRMLRNLRLNNEIDPNNFIFGVTDIEPVRDEDVLSETPDLFGDEKALQTQDEKDLLTVDATRDDVYRQLAQVQPDLLIFARDRYEEEMKAARLNGWQAYVQAVDRMHEGMSELFRGANWINNLMNNHEGQGVHSMIMPVSSDIPHLFTQLQDGTAEQFRQMVTTQFPSLQAEWLKNDKLVKNAEAMRKNDKTREQEVKRDKMIARLEARRARAGANVFRLFGEVFKNNIDKTVFLRKPRTEEKEQKVQGPLNMRNVDQIMAASADELGIKEIDRKLLRHTLQSNKISKHQFTEAVAIMNGSNQPHEIQLPAKFLGTWWSKMLAFTRKTLRMNSMAPFLVHTPEKTEEQFNVLISATAVGLNRHEDVSGILTRWLSVNVKKGKGLSTILGLVKGSIKKFYKEERGWDISSELSLDKKIQETNLEKRLNGQTDAQWDLYNNATDKFLNAYHKISRPLDDDRTNRTKQRRQWDNYTTRDQKEMLSVMEQFKSDRLFHELLRIKGKSGRIRKRTAMAAIRSGKRLPNRGGEYDSQLMKSDSFKRAFKASLRDTYQKEVTAFRSPERPEFTDIKSQKEDTDSEAEDQRVVDELEAEQEERLRTLAVQEQPPNIDRPFIDEAKRNILDEFKDAVGENVFSEDRDQTTDSRSTGSASVVISRNDQTQTPSKSDDSAVPSQGPAQTNEEQDSGPADEQDSSETQAPQTPQSSDFGSNNIVVTDSKDTESDRGIIRDESSTQETIGDISTIEDNSHSGIISANVSEEDHGNLTQALIDQLNDIRPGIDEPIRDEDDEDDEESKAFSGRESKHDPEEKADIPLSQISSIDLGTDSRPDDSSLSIFADRSEADTTSTFVSDGRSTGPSVQTAFPFGDPSSGPSSLLPTMSFSSDSPGPGGPHVPVFALAAIVPIPKAYLFTGWPIFIDQPTQYETVKYPNIMGDSQTPQDPIPMHDEGWIIKYKDKTEFHPKTDKHVTILKEMSKQKKIYLISSDGRNKLADLTDISIGRSFVQFHGSATAFSHHKALKTVHKHAVRHGTSLLKHKRPKGLKDLKIHDHAQVGGSFFGKIKKGVGHTTSKLRKTFTKQNVIHGLNRTFQPVGDTVIKRGPAALAAGNKVSNALRTPAGQKLKSALFKAAPELAVPLMALDTSVRVGHQIVNEKSSSGAIKEGVSGAFGIARAAAAANTGGSFITGGSFSRLPSDPSAFDKERMAKIKAASAGKPSLLSGGSIETGGGGVSGGSFITGGSIGSTGGSFDASDLNDSLNKSNKIIGDQGSSHNLGFRPVKRLTTVDDIGSTHPMFGGMINTSGSNHHTARIMKRLSNGISPSINELSNFAKNPLAHVLPHINHPLGKLGGALLKAAFHTNKNPHNHPQEMANLHQHVQNIKNQHGQFGAGLFDAFRGVGDGLQAANQAGASAAGTAQKFGSIFPDADWDTMNHNYQVSTNMKQDVSSSGSSAFSRFVSSSGDFLSGLFESKASKDKAKQAIFDSDDTVGPGGFGSGFSGINNKLFGSKSDIGFRDSSHDNRGGAFLTGGNLDQAFLQHGASVDSGKLLSTGKNRFAKQTSDAMDFYHKAHQHPQGKQQILNMSTKFARDHPTHAMNIAKEVHSFSKNTGGGFWNTLKTGTAATILGATAAGAGALAYNVYLQNNPGTAAEISARGVGQKVGINSGIGNQIDSALGDFTPSFGSGFNIADEASGRFRGPQKPKKNRTGGGLGKNISDILLAGSRSHMRGGSIGSTGGGLGRALRSGANAIGGLPFSGGMLNSAGLASGGGIHSDKVHPGGSFTSHNGMPFSSGQQVNELQNTMPTTGDMRPLLRESQKLDQMPAFHRPQLSHPQGRTMPGTLQPISSSWRSRPSVEDPSHRQPRTGGGFTGSHRGVQPTMSVPHIPANTFPHQQLQSHEYRVGNEHLGGGFTDTEINTFESMTPEEMMHHSNKYDLARKLTLQRRALKRQIPLIEYQNQSCCRGDNFNDDQLTREEQMMNMARYNSPFGINDSAMSTEFINPKKTYYEQSAATETFYDGEAYPGNQLRIDYDRFRSDGLQQFRNFGHRGDGFIKETTKRKRKNLANYRPNMSGYVITNTIDPMSQ